MLPLATADTDDAALGVPPTLAFGVGVVFFDGPKRSSISSLALFGLFVEAATPVPTAEEDEEDGPSPKRASKSSTFFVAHQPAPQARRYSLVKPDADEGVFDLIVDSKIA